MTSSLEQLILDGLNFNDEVTLGIEGGTFNFTPGQKQPQWIGNPDADGEVLADEPIHGNSTFTFTVRILPKVTMDLALAVHGEILDKLQKCSLMRDQGGLGMPWTPAGSSRTYTAYALLGELPELPITPTGDLAGWFINSPVLPIKITCDPFLELPERQVLAPVSSELPLQVVELPGVGGDVPARGRAILTEKSSVDRRHLEWGLDQNSGACLITAASLVTTGFTGVAKTRSGAYSAEKVIRAVAVNAWTPMCGTGNLSILGTLGVKARVWPTSAAARFRISYRVGDGPFKTLDAVIPPGINNWYEIDLGEITAEEVIAGAQRVEIRPESLSAEGAPENDLNYLEFMPTGSGYGKGRGLQSNAATQLLAYDNFDQAEEANLDKPVALPLGGSWAEVNKTGASGFKVIPAQHVAQRTAVSDANLNSGCYALAPTSYTTVSVSAAVSASILITESLRLGVLARYTNVENWLMAVYTGWPGFIGGFGRPAFTVLKRVAGVVSVLDEFRWGSFESGGALSPRIATFNAAADGTWQAWGYPVGSSAGAPLLEGQDAAVATGGALAAGKCGIYDAYTSATANTRTVDSFNVVAAPEAGRACFSSRKAEVRADSDQPLQRQDSTGVYDGPPSTYRGSRFYIPPAGDAGAIARLAVKMRRNDVDQEPDVNVTDKQELEVLITERFLTPR